VLEGYANGMQQDTPHLLMSVTKSVVGCVVGILVERGQLDPEELITTYVPDLTLLGLRLTYLRNPSGSRPDGPARRSSAH
jgi:CubicO group peptidase (beta-lactamase class C family)